MPILIVEHNGRVEGVSLSGRVLIGRRASNHVVIVHPDVSRIHAWIDTAGHQFCVTDAGSRTGTFVNGNRVTGKVALRHGDRIDVGPAGLTFRADASLPAGVSELAFGGREKAHDADGGFVLDCACGAPLWASTAFAGRTGACRFCGAAVRVPEGAGTFRRDTPPMQPAQLAQPAKGFVDVAAGATVAQRTAGTDTCGACQSLIAPLEPVTSCPACGLTFHADCWTENYGCSAYGCSQVNVLLPKPPPLESVGSTATGGPAGEGAAVAAEAPDVLAEPGVGDSNAAAARDDKVPHEYLLLGASVAGSVAGALAFGVPALLALVGVVVYWRRHPRMPHPRVAWAAALMALAGGAAGGVISYVWWLGGWSGPS